MLFILQWKKNKNNVNSFIFKKNSFLSKQQNSLKVKILMKDTGKER